MRVRERESVERETLTWAFGRLSFTQGFLVGQLTVILLVFAFVKFFILAESNESLSSSPMLKGKQVGWRFGFLGLF